MFRFRQTHARVTHTLHGVFDPFLIVITLALLLVGIIMVYNASVVIAIRDFNDQFYYVREQLKGLVAGSIILLFFAVTHYKKLYAWALPMLCVTLVLLGAVFIPGLGVRALGASRWINLGFINLQPAEFAKLSLSVYLSAWLSTKEKGRFGSFLLLVAMIVGLVLIEPDMGTSIVLVSLSMIVYFVSGAPIRHFLFIIPFIIVAFIGLAVVSPYRFARLTTFINPQSDPLGASYQIRQALVAVGSGGFWGVGIGKSRQKYEYLPEANTDSIFAIISEETGFTGSIAFIGMYILLIWRGFVIATRASDNFSRLLAVAITSWIGVQSAINIGANLAILPLTGIPLPFVSFGSSGLVVTLAGIGILLNISANGVRK